MEKNLGKHADRMWSRLGDGIMSDICFLLRAFFDTF